MSIEVGFIKKRAIKHISDSMSKKVAIKQISDSMSKQVAIKHISDSMSKQVAIKHSSDSMSKKTSPVRACTLPPAVFFLKNDTFWSQKSDFLVTFGNV